MNFGQLQALVSYWLDDLQFGYFTQTQVKIWLNNAQKEVQKRLIKAGQNYYVKCVQTTLVPNQADYVIPQDFKKLNRFVVVMSGTPPNETVNPIMPITLNQQDLVQSNVGTPTFYYMKKNRFTLIPAPEVALPLRLYYSYEVSDMVNDTDVPDVPDSYVELIALLAAQDGFIKDGRVSELLVKKIAEYQVDLDNDAQERLQDLPRSVVETGNDSTYGYYF